MYFCKFNESTILSDYIKINFMNILIRCCFAMILFTSPFFLSAQTYMVKAGLNLAKVHFTIEDNVDINNQINFKPGFYVGGAIDFPIKNNFSLESGLFLSNKGFNANQSDFNGQISKVDLTLDVVYLEIPVTAKATFNVGKSKIYGLFGPYAGIGLWGNQRISQSAGGEKFTSESKVVWGSDEFESDVKRFDLGIMIGTGVEINKLQFGLTFSQGLSSIAPTNIDEIKTTNRVLMLSIGYRFGLKKAE